MAAELISLLRNRDEPGLRTLLAEDVRFHSPVADYTGRADVAHLFGLIAGVLADLEPVREVADGARYDEDRHLAEATLLLRPLAPLQQAIAEMAEALADAPLPSSR